MGNGYCDWQFQISRWSGCRTWARVVLRIKICRSAGVSFQSQDSKIYKIQSTLPCRGVAKGNQLTLFKLEGVADYAPHTTTSSPQFKKLSTPLPWVHFVCLLFRSCLDIARSTGPWSRRRCSNIRRNTKRFRKETT